MNANVSETIESDTPAVRLPDADVRLWLDERALRGWTESSYRACRVVLLVVADLVSGLSGVYTVLATWSLVSAQGTRPVPNPIPLIAMVACLQPLALRGTGAYRGGRAKTDLVRIAGGVFLAAFLGWIQARLFGRVEADLPNKTAYLYAAIVITPLAWIARLLVDWIAARARRSGLLQHRVLVVGTAGDAEDLFERCAAATSDVTIVGRLSADVTDELETLCRVDASEDQVPFFVGGTTVLHRALSQTGARSVIVTSSVPAGRLESIIADCFVVGAGVALLPDAQKQFATASIEVRQTTAGSLLQLQPLRLEVPQMAVKRAMDLIISGLALLSVAPLLAIIAIAIKLDSPGPVLFRQTRMGVGGSRFKILKFRTMVVDADEQKAHLQHLNEYADSRLFKIKNDPRVTSLGRILRKLSLDELPQLWNVMRGDMSLVGPRPCVPEEFERYAPHHMERLFVVPGVTGPWQVNGRNSITDFEQVVRLDSEYIRTWSLTRDVVILLKTIPTLFGRGAY